MTFEQIHNAIRSRFFNLVHQPEGLWTIYDNDSTQAPTDGRMWCRHHIEDGSSEQIAIGGTRYRMVGIMYASLFGPVSKGDKDLLVMADKIVLAFRGQTAEGVSYRSAQLNIVGQGEDEYQVNVLVPFDAEHQP
jgi:hypothetical protein